MCKIGSVYIGDTSRPCLDADPINKPPVSTTYKRFNQSLPPPCWQQIANLLLLGGQCSPSCSLLPIMRSIVMSKEESCPSFLHFDQSQPEPSPSLKYGAARTVGAALSGVPGGDPLVISAQALAPSAGMTRTSGISRVEQLKDKVSEIGALLRSGGPSITTNFNTDTSAASGDVQARAASPPSRGTSNPHTATLSIDRCKWLLNRHQM